MRTKTPKKKIQNVVIQSDPNLENEKMLINNINFKSDNNPSLLLSGNK